MNDTDPASAPVPTRTAVIGIRAFGRFVLFIFFSLCFLGLAVATRLLDGPWTVSVAYVICFIVMLVIARKVFPRRAKAGSTTRRATPETRAARRSGNPAIRATQPPEHRPGNSAKH
ncbi:MAG TPA: hypothetical protein VMT88_09440 [Actinomycetes bacterium]|nr:hypothetical protein [Actinomycetes bacterium]